MSTNRPLSASNGPQSERSEFELQREELLVEVARSLENVLGNLNKLNRNLEQVVAVGHEFSSVEALWSRFEDVMAKDPDAEKEEAQDEGDVTNVNVGVKP